MPFKPKGHSPFGARPPRPSPARRGYDRRWRKASKLFLASHPLCHECEARGVVKAATVVDHNKPHQGDEVLFWDESNWRAKCKECHDRKTATYDGGFGR